MKIGISGSDLHKYAERRVYHQRKTRGTVLGSGSIAILDQRSITDSTVVFHQFHRKDLWEECDELFARPAEVTDNGDFWYKWRVPFNKAWPLYTSVSNLSIAEDTVAMFSKPQYQSPDGVIDVEAALKDRGY